MSLPGPPLAAWLVGRSSVPAQGFSLAIDTVRTLHGRRARHDRVQQLRGGWGWGVVDDQKVGHSLSVVAGRGARKSSRVLFRTQ